MVGKFRISMLGEYRRILVDQGEGAAQDRRGGAAILFQNYPLSVGEMTVEKIEGRAGRAAEAVDRLIGIADGEDVSARSGEARENLNLREVGILKFVGQDEAGTGACLGENAVRRCAAKHARA